MTAGSKLVALDVDGTVLHEDGRVSPAVREAVQGAVRRGHRLMLATGRSWEATHPVQDQLGLRGDYAVCANGALTMKRTDGGYVRHHYETFDPSAVLPLIHEHLDDGRYLVEYPSGFRRYTEGMSEWDLQGAEQVEFDELLRAPVSRIVVVSPGRDEQDFLQIVQDMGLHEVTYAIGWSAWLDIAPLGVDKSTALERVRASLGIPREDVVAVGDGRNDVEMVRWAARSGRGVSMGQGPDELKEVASEVADDIAGDGLAAVLESL